MLKASCVLGTSVVLLSSGTVLGAFQNTMYESAAHPSSYGTLVQSLNIADTAYDFPFDNNFFTNSGYVNEVAGFEFDRTELVSEVYRVNTAQSFMSGGNTINLSPNDMVFSYRLRLVEASTNTINTMREFQVQGINLLPGSDAMDANLLLGRGFHLSGGAVNTPEEQPADLLNLGPAGSKVDFNWEGADTDQLDNSQEITLLLFTQPSSWGNGTATFAAAPGQSGGADPNAANAPILIPIIPAPGAAIAFGLAGIGLSTRRARR